VEQFWKMFLRCFEDEMRIKKNTKWRVWNRDRFICQICFTEVTVETRSVDHVIPQHRGGSNDMDNLITAHKSCNHDKGIREEYRVYTKLSTQ
jgi:5-methylcytosine-specific restriction endonuclease McrA